MKVSHITSTVKLLIEDVNWNEIWWHTNNGTLWSENCENLSFSVKSIKEVLKEEIGEVKVMKVSFVKSIKNVLLWEVEVKVLRVNLNEMKK